LKNIIGTISKQACALLIFSLLSACSTGKHIDTDLKQPVTEEKPVATAEQPLQQNGEEANIPGLDNMQEEPIADPLEPWNRMMFTFNDKLYFWAMKPVIKGYNWAVPENARKSIRNFFYNLEMPTRFVSSVLQIDVKAAGIELARFTINSTIGVVGLFDVAKNKFKLEPQEKDVGQTFGKYGIGEGIYLVWPFLGPSSLRDTVGSASDIYLSPWTKVHPPPVAAAIGGFEYFNRNSFDAGEYEELVNSAVEPYSALKNAYVQYRRNVVKEK